MPGLALVVFAALALGLVGVIAFVWNLNSGQYDDLDGAAARILLPDEDGAVEPRSSTRDAKR